MNDLFDKLVSRWNEYYDNKSVRPTSTDRRNLMQIRDGFKSLSDADLSHQEQLERTEFYLFATEEANRQEAFFESNGNKWADAI